MSFKDSIEKFTFFNEAKSPYLTVCKNKCFQKTLSTVMLALFVLNFTGCGIFPKEEEALAPPLVEPAAVTYDEYEVKKGNIEVTVKGFADFQSEKLYNESFKFSVSYLKSIGVKTGDTVKIGQVLAEQETDSLKNDLKKKQLKLRSDQLNYDKTKNALNSAVDEKTKFDLNIQLEQQNITIELDKIDIEEVQKNIDRSQLKSSIDGTVVYVDTAINSGDRVTTNKTVVTVADPTNLQLRFSGNGMEKFFYGAKVNVNYNNKDYTGAVVMDQSNIPTDANAAMKKYIKIKLDEMPPNVKMGDTAGITLVLEKKENVIVIPQSLLHQADGRNYIEMLQNGLRVQRNVEIGLKNATDVEIVKGLNEGEKILK